MILLLSILAAVYKTVRWLQVQSFELDDRHQNASVYSTLTVHVSSSGTGLMNKYFYRFKNVRIWRGRMKFFYDPDGPFELPTHEYDIPCLLPVPSSSSASPVRLPLYCIPFQYLLTLLFARPLRHWVDIISCNATSAQPPTMLVIKVDAPIRWEYMPIDYIPLSRSKDACHASATSVVERTAYLLQVRYSYNIWHTWGEAGLMSLFQTLREINALPIATVDTSGSLRELENGASVSLGDTLDSYPTAASDDGGCPWTYDNTLQRAVRQKSCEKVRILDGASCSPQTQPWCRPGAVVSPLRDDPSAPLIVTYTPQSTKNIWSHLYDTITSNQKTLKDLEGACFEDLIVGKSSTLNFYQALNMTTPAATILEKVPRIDNSKARVRAMAIFKAFIISSQQEWVARKGLTFDGYEDPGLELLRRGVAEPDHEALDAINPKQCAGSIREEIDELKRNFEAHEELVAPSVAEYERQYGPVVVPSSLSSRSALELRDEESIGYFNRGNVGSSGANQARGEMNTISGVEKASAETMDSNNTDLPVVTYMSRNFFSRGVINEASILRYVLEHYKVVLKVTTFQEPLGEVMVRRLHKPMLPTDSLTQSFPCRSILSTLIRIFYRRQM